VTQGNDCTVVHTCCHAKLAFSPIKGRVAPVMMLKSMQKILSSSKTALMQPSLPPLPQLMQILLLLMLCHFLRPLLTPQVATARLATTTAKSGSRGRRFAKFVAINRPATLRSTAAMAGMTYQESLACPTIVAFAALSLQSQTCVQDSSAAGPSLPWC